MIRQLIAALGAGNTRPLRLLLFGLGLTAVLQGVAFVLLVPVLRALFAADYPAAWRWFGVLAVVTIAYAVAQYRAQLAGYASGAALSRQLHERLGDHLVRLPLGWFTGARVGQVSRLAGQNVLEIIGVPAHLLQPLVTALVTPATVVVLMFGFDWRLALAALIAAPVLVGAYRWSGSLVQRADLVRDEATTEAADRVIEFARAQQVLRAFGRTTGGHEPLAGSLAAQHAASRRMILLGLPGTIGFALVIQAAYTAILILGVYLALGGSLGAAELLALLVLATRFVEPIMTASDIGGAARVARNALIRINEVLAAEPLPTPDDPKTPSDNGIELDSVRFAYRDRPVLDGVSLRIPPGSMTALVGASGAGKTTVTKLIARFHDVDAGAVRIGGADVRELDQDELMARMSLVFQDVYLFNDTIMENIRVGRPDAPDADVIEAARRARVDEIVARLAGGWHTMVGEGGALLSGGERQRVSIARALLKDAPILVLDEATAALDWETEAAVQDALSTDRTLLVIAHRLSTVKAADQIAVLDEGRIAECGTHDELLAAGGRYAAFWTERSRAAQWRLTGSATVRAWTAS
ncbi:ABC transporter ATP-binding protein [Amycolatopsis sp. NPDC058986]|uniref:ABC transporter ATP-binding protein n=1 Tax=unclassified Amycolatopsis TaxID=2618356 RepID=UPI00366CCB37